jgi:CMP/dCMP kinase
MLPLPTPGTPPLSSTGQPQDQVRGLVGGHPGAPRHAGRKQAERGARNCVNTVAPAGEERVEASARRASERQQGNAPRPFVVAIDGPAASGKGTLARRLAARFGLAHLETGVLYRATALLVLKANADPADPVAAAAAARRVDQSLLSDRLLRDERVARAASAVAANPEVRRALLDFQRDFATHPPAPAQGAVLDGRDIGSVVCPAADVKLFVTADPEVRACRRLAELQASGVAAIYWDVLQELKDRDTRDAERGTAPMAVPPDAIVIDTTALDADAVLEHVSGIVSRALADAR